MFDDTDRTLQGWFVVAGRTADGLVLDLLSGRPEVRLERPASDTVAALAPNAAWAAYWRQMTRPQYVGLRTHLADYFCRRWNRTAAADRTITHVDVRYMAFQHYDPARPPVQELQRLVDRECPPD
jgi:hypothetical protein